VVAENLMTNARDRNCVRWALGICDADQPSAIVVAGPSGRVPGALHGGPVGLRRRPQATPLKRHRQGHET
jgi:hypothetical protein